MLPFPKLLLVLFGLNILGSLVFFIAGFQKPSSLVDLQLATSQELYTQPEKSEKSVEEPQSAPKPKKTEFRTPLSGKKWARNQTFFEMAPIVSPDGSFTRTTNPFYLLGAYPEVKVAIPYENKLETPFTKKNYGIVNEDDYCERVDYYNLAHPDNIFKKLNFLSDYADDTIARKHVIKKIGTDTNVEINKYAPANYFDDKEYTLDESINTFFINMDAFHRYHQIGKNFLCATQMYNHIPGSRAMIRKDDLIESVSRWVGKHNGRSQCFNEDMYFPKSYRLSIQEECDTFFNKLKSKKYQKSLFTNPIQYMIKVGHGSHSAEGVYLVDKETTAWLMTEFNSGTKCGSINTTLIAQAYVSNPLLLDMNNKFDFRVYMLVASTNPLIVYYHDGFLRAALSPYDKFSTDREKHLTNTHLAYEAFSKARQEGSYNGKTEEELREAHIWNFEDLQKYLLESGKITDENWLDNYLRPQFKKVMIHLVKMTSAFYLKQSNVYGLFGLDFMLDDKFNLWFIEANPNPQMLPTSRFLGELLVKMVQSLFEIEYGLYRSRMKRVLDIIKPIRQHQEHGFNVQFSEWKKEFQKANRNQFEPEFVMGGYNSFELVMDENLPGEEAYRGYLDRMCVFAH